MADKQYPIRLDIRTPEQRAEDTGARGAGAQVREVLATGMDNATRGIGNRFRTMVGGVAPLIAAASALAEPLKQQSNRVAVRDFVDGVTGQPKGGRKVPLQAPAPVARQQVARSPAPAAPRQVTTDDRLNAFVSTVLGGPATLRQATMAAGLAPAPAKPRSAKDVTLQTASEIADASFKNELAQAAKLTDQAAKDAANQKATDNYFNRKAALVGVDTSNFSLQDMIDQGGN